MAATRDEPSSYAQRFARVLEHIDAHDRWLATSGELDLTGTDEDGTPT